VRGAFGSPLLLMRSGIGPLASLRAAGVDPVAPLDGVGANLQDHPWCLLDVDVTDVAAIEARPVSGALLRYELPGPPGAHIEAEIFGWQTRPYLPRRPPPSLLHGGADGATQPGRLSMDPGRSSRRGRTSHRRSGRRPDGRDRDDHRAPGRRPGRQRLLRCRRRVGGARTTWWRRAGGPLATYNHHSGTCRMEIRPTRTPSSTRCST